MTSISDQMAAWGRRGGQSRSEEKREAARRNVARARSRIGRSVPHTIQERCLPAPAVLIPQQKEGQQ
jgi:hypothetical protein